MPQVREVLYTDVFARTLEAPEKTVINRGGARSSKSYSQAQLLIYKATNSKREILVTRKTMPSLKMTAYKLIIDLLKDYGYYNDNNHYQTSPCHYRLGKSTFWFVSIDDLEKIKSTEFTDIWMEESNEFTKQEYLVLKMRLSGKLPPGERTRIYLTFNPIDANHWIPTWLVPQADTREIVSTYLDNPFLTQDYIETLLSLEQEDLNYFKIYALGEYGAVENLIYHNFDYKALDGEPDSTCRGLDFGFNNPTVLVRIDEKDQELYVTEEIYESKLITSSPDPDKDTLLKRMAELNINKNDVMTGDSEDPKTIEEIYQAGYNIHGADKGKDSVRRGIGILKRKRIHINPASVNLAKEFQSYKWKQDKNGNILDEPVKFNDHGMDATRYGIQGVMDMPEPMVFIRTNHEPITEDQVGFQTIAG